MLKITTVNKGAELVSVIQNDIEKIHDGVNDWNRHAPVLFPIVGKVKDGKTMINGKECFSIKGSFNTKFFGPYTLRPSQYNTIDIRL